MAKSSKTDKILEYIGKKVKELGTHTIDAAKKHPVIATGVGAGTLYGLGRGITSTVNNIMPIPSIPKDVLVSDGNLAKSAGWLDSTGEAIGSFFGGVKNWDDRYTAAAADRFRQYGGWSRLGRDVGNAALSPYYAARDAIRYVDNKVINPIYQGISTGYRNATGAPAPKPPATPPKPPTPSPAMGRFGRYGGWAAGGLAAAYLAYNMMRKNSSYNPYNRYNYNIKRGSYMPYRNYYYNPYMTKQAWSWPWQTDKPKSRSAVSSMPVGDPTAGMNTAQRLWHNTKANFKSPIGALFLGMNIWDLPGTWADSFNRAFHPGRYSWN